MLPAIIRTTVKMEKKAPNTLLIPHDSNLFVNGNSMNDISNAKPKGIRIDLAKIKIAKSAITLANA
jgi:hypothetical protein